MRYLIHSGARQIYPRGSGERGLAWKAGWLCGLLPECVAMAKEGTSSRHENLAQTLLCRQSIGKGVDGVKGVRASCTLGHSHLVRFLNTYLSSFIHPGANHRLLHPDPPCHFVDDLSSCSTSRQLQPCYPTVGIRLSQPSVRLSQPPVRRPRSPWLKQNVKSSRNWSARCPRRPVLPRPLLKAGPCHLPSPRINQTLQGQRVYPPNHQAHQLYPPDHVAPRLALTSGAPPPGIENGLCFSKPATCSV
ncbi:hypothetical protein QBC41DRAFT_384039 [Cercophora samala]|uniref:Uncharacterized protein n=1 Tax=Cercophora samala TaxID=330535 RepID=A0AA39ZJK7_9PEZI|nr:hypothetical protein QBC41DRAFT_384039 [Cercophora samala]